MIITWQLAKAATKHKNIQQIKVTAEKPLNRKEFIV